MGTKRRFAVKVALRPDLHPLWCVETQAAVILMHAQRPDRGPLSNAMEVLHGILCTAEALRLRVYLDRISILRQLLIRFHLRPRVAAFDELHTLPRYLDARTICVLLVSAMPRGDKQSLLLLSRFSAFRLS
jgi:hypothetical protein